MCVSQVGDAASITSKRTGNEMTKRDVQIVDKSAMYVALLVRVMGLCVCRSVGCVCVFTLCCCKCHFFVDMLHWWLWHV